MAGALYVPPHARDGGGTPTAVVYDPADPVDAMAEGALRWTVVDLVAKRVVPFTVALVPPAVGAAGAPSRYGDRRDAVRRDHTGGVPPRYHAGQPQGAPRNPSPR